MKKKTVLIAGCILIGVAICIIALRKSNTPQSVTPETPTKRQGQIIGEMYRQEKNGTLNKKIYAKGRTISITKGEFEAIKQVYEAAGKENAGDEALISIIKDKLMFNKATQEGYKVSQKEVADSIKKMKKALHGEDEFKEFKELTEGFGSEEEYWEYAAELAEKDLPVQKYLEDLQADFAKEMSSETDDQELQERWTKKLEDMKNKMVQEEAVTVL